MKGRLDRTSLVPGDSPTVERWAVKTCLVYVPLVLRKLEIKEIKPIKEVK